MEYNILAIAWRAQKDQNNPIQSMICGANSMVSAQSPHQQLIPVGANSRSV